ncbi:protein kinase domain-containing protein [Variovorax sp. S12S4]|uniref:protein kinase domain-containing protein n=1 Tax=Variovorax sp. S12S4 TaxID=3029170 RepID=UPI0031586E29
MFEVGTVIDNRFVVQSLCSDAGGMGTLLFVAYVGMATPVMVLKYCKLPEAEARSRFRREVRVMQQFEGNSYVMPILAANLDHDPPYFVMPFYENGDLSARAQIIRDDLPAIEVYFNHMIDCISQLHARSIFHRDIKPQNFLHSGNRMVVSDLGLCTEHGSSTAFTRQSMYWGTEGYLPPEFLQGGFKDADAAGDIFMLGKTFYSVLSGRNPIYLMADGIPGALFPVIERCCAMAKASRYQSLAALKQSLKAAFDAVLGRAIGPISADGLQRAITDRLKASGNYEPGEVGSFIEALAMLTAQDKYQVCMASPKELFLVMALEIDAGLRAQFVQIYQQMALEATYAWSFAEEIASNMKVLFDAHNVSAQTKAEALRSSIIAAVRQNRFAAMETCTKMISSVEDPELAQRVHDILIEHDCHFLQHIEPSGCRSPIVRHAIEGLKAQEDARLAALPGASPLSF